MKKTLLLVATALMAMAATSCKKEKTPGPVEDPGYTINGVTWAYTNVGIPGTFMQSSAQFGYYYKFNSRIGWSPTESDPVSSPAGTAWDSAGSTSGDWTAENDPCPEGWRVPTVTEIQSLGDPNRVSMKPVKVTYQGVDVAGLAFTDKLYPNPNGGLFFPLSNYLNASGKLANSAEESSGEYWSSTYAGDPGGYSMGLVTTDGSKLGDTSATGLGLTIRCVRGTHS